MPGREGRPSPSGVPIPSGPRVDTGADRPARRIVFRAGADQAIAAPRANVANHCAVRPQSARIEPLRSPGRHRQVSVDQIVFSVGTDRKHRAATGARVMPSRSVRAHRGDANGTGAVRNGSRAVPAGWVAGSLPGPGGSARGPGGGVATGASAEGGGLPPEPGQPVAAAGSGRWGRNRRLEGGCGWRSRPVPAPRRRFGPVAGTS